MPGGPGNYAAFDVPTLQGENLAFYGVYAGNSWAGIYSAPDKGGTITRIADFNTAMPGGTNNFNIFGRVSVSASSVAFLGHYSYSGTITDGIYSAPVSGGTVTRVASDGMIAPASTASFTSFGSPTTDGTYVAFNASTVSSLAVNGLWRYKLDGTGGSVIADENNVIPGHGTTKFSYFYGVSMSTGVPVFNGGDGANIYGIWADANGTLIKIIESGDALDGKIVQGTQIYDQGVSGNTDDIAFYTTFTNGSAGIYVAQVPLTALGVAVPEPASLALFACAAAALLIRHQTRRRA